MCFSNRTLAPLLVAMRRSKSSRALELTLAIT